MEGSIPLEKDFFRKWKECLAPFKESIKCTISKGKTN
jgi:hypothetical protein